MRAGELVTIPSPVDVHSHFREPGGEQKETIATGTYAALKGGYQATCDMPNNPGGMETRSEQRVDDKTDIAERTAFTDFGIIGGVDLDNPAIDQFGPMIPKVVGLKAYLGLTTGNIKEYGLDEARVPIDEWIARATILGKNPPIMLHAREGIGEEVADYVAAQDYPVHWCHVSTETEVDSVRRLNKKYKDLGVFTSGLTMHHMTMVGLDADFKYGWYGGRMMPPLGNEVDHEALVHAYNNAEIPILETDHAPHEYGGKEKAESENPEGHNHPDCTTCFGLSGIEFILPIAMSLVARKKITMERLVDSLRTQPLQMLGIRDSGRAETDIYINPYVLGADDRAGKSRNNPYVGWTAWGKVQDVRVNGVSRWNTNAVRVRMGEAAVKIMTTGGEI